MARRLGRLGIGSVRDLLLHVPVGYRDRRAFTTIDRLEPGTDASVVATVVDAKLERRRQGRSDLRATLRDDTGFARAVWFNQGFRASQLKAGERYLFSGSVQAFRGVELHNPEFEPEEGNGERVHVARLAPRYALTEGVTERWLRSRVRETLNTLAAVPEVVPPEWSARFDLPTFGEALERVHFPEELDQADAARRRIALEELLSLQIALQFARRRHRNRYPAAGLAAGAAGMDRFLAALPFPLTGAQRRAIEAIAKDVDDSVPMRRMLLGDVGSGKTVVALAAAARAAAAGSQTALLAPTSILAEQHARTAEHLLAGSGIGTALLTGATAPAERQAIVDAIAAGRVSLVIGTHALLEQDLAFRSLGLVVVDEQHRFGVRQRVALAEKGAAGGSGGTGAHLLVLSATPIPRSLAMAIYGDLDLSTLDEKPPGRAPVVTDVVRGEDRAAVVDLLVREVADGGSAFVVYPMVEESEGVDLKAATAMATALARVPELQEAGVALIHGRLKPAERRAAIERFRDGTARVLVATTVVEVGLDIPDATLVLIEHPERFGLAQLHQLRGRVGRAGRPGRCVLAITRETGDLARRRLAIFRKIADGFTLAEEDLRLRGPGELLGTSQHGFPELRVADALRDADLMEAARDLSAELLERAEREEGSGRVRAWIQAHFEGAERYLGSG